MLPFNSSWDFWEHHSNVALHIGMTEISSSHLRHGKSVRSKNIMPIPHSFDSHACHLTLYSEIGTYASLWVSILALIVKKGLDMTTAVTWPPSFPDDAIQTFMWPERILNHMAVTDFSTYICACLKHLKIPSMLWVWVCMFTGTFRSIKDQQRGKYSNPLHRHTLFQQSSIFTVWACGTSLRSICLTLLQRLFGHDHSIFSRS